MDISMLKTARNKDFSSITSELEKVGNPDQKSYVDERFWKPERDKAGNATATIRFLPRTIKEINGDVVKDELPWVKLFSHGFQGPSGKWFIEDCPTTLNQECSVCSYNQRLWNSTDSDSSPERKQVRNQKRKLSYIANILVVDDPKHPENNGEVRLFKFGKKIFEKIQDKARPAFDDEEPVNVFDYWDGANFKLRMKQVDGYPNYDNSVFANPAPIGSDEDILRVAKNQHLLQDFLDPKNFKSAEELKKKLEYVLAMGDPIPSAHEIAEARAAAPVAPPPAIRSKPSAMEDDEDMMQYFAALANDD